MSIDTANETGTGAVPANWEPKIIGFLCYWCSYTGADGAGTARLKYAPNVDIVKLMCSGRIDPELITTAFASGADAVLVCGCHIGDCHYLEGNHKTMVRMPLLKKVLIDLGIEPERFRHEWISASEGAEFAELVNGISADVKKLGPLNWPQLIHERGVGHGMDLKSWESNNGRQWTAETKDRDVLGIQLWRLRYFPAGDWRKHSQIDRDR